MKTKLAYLTITVGLILAASAAILAQGTNAPPKRDLIIQTNPTNYLSAAAIRMTFLDVSLDATTFKPMLTVNIEAWGIEENNGVTNSVLIRRQTLTLTTAQLNAWNAATNGQAFIETALLDKTRLTKRQ